MKICQRTLLFFMSLYWTIRCSTESKWTIDSLSQYTIDKYAQDHYFLSDPINYINESQRKVIYVRLKEIFSKLNISAFFFVVDKLSYDTEAENEIKNGKEFASQLSRQILKNNSLVNHKNVLLVLFSIEEKEIFIHKEEYLQQIITAEEDTKYKEYTLFINKPKDTYTAVDVFLTDFLYAHAKSTTDKVLSGIGMFGEIITIASVIIVFIFYNTKRKNTEENNSQDNNSTPKSENQNGDIKDKKKED